MRSNISLFATVCLLVLTAWFAGACSVAETSTVAETAPAPASAELKEPVKKGSVIEITPNGPADVVRAFYEHLREKRFRHAIYLTNLRPAIEQLSDRELKEYQVDLENVAKFVPSDVQINGEIISGDQATVTARLPGADYEKTELQEIRLRRVKAGWMILGVDEFAEQRVKKEGKNFLRNLRIETHQDEARQMLDRIAKAQMAYAAQNGGRFAGMHRLIEDGLLPNDVLSVESTGYAYAVTVSEDGAKYHATATPADYRKSGIMSYLVRLGENGTPLLTSIDNGGKPLEN
ncbi:MAG: hypothetical protein AB7Q37_00840 [Pyrinomonadaceae bacterium]